MRKIELLAPARDVQIAREAVLHGADAVYIGAPRFGARAAAGNSVEDIRQLVEFAHVYGVRVYVTLNTILYDEELSDVKALATQLCHIGVDAFIVQDMAFLEMDLPPISLHASTQMDNRTAEKVKWLKELGFQQVVLARELSLKDIQAIHRAVPDVALEAFVHGATCVSYNGQCYASQYCFGRSANRGECAQFCRLPFDLVDAEGRVVSDSRCGEPVRQRHLLSLRDMNRSDDLEAMMDAGVTSFKIEGRLKDATYVKNVTAFYRQRIDDIIARRADEFQRSSIGISSVDFVPQLDRSFNRGFSSYFLTGRQQNMVQLCSPKSTGQFVGHVKEIRRNCFTVSSTVSFTNGDGLCFIDANGNLQGFRINRVEGNCLYPKDMPAGLLPRLRLYRNYDQAFATKLSHPTATRRIPVSWTLHEVQAPSLAPATSSSQSPSSAGASACGMEDNAAGTIAVRLESVDGISAEMQFTLPLAEARTSQRENISRQLSRLGDTPFLADRVDVQFSSDWFIPSSLLSDWRRQLVRLLLDKRLLSYSPPAPFRAEHPSEGGRLSSSLSYRANVSNHLSRTFYKKCGATSIEPAFELCEDQKARQRTLMTLKYCPKYELGLCGQSIPGLALRSSDGRLFPLRFDCRHCLVEVMSPKSANT